MSNFNINQFMSEFQSGFQQPSQFRCKLPMEDVSGGELVQRFGKAAEYLGRGLLCQTTRTPSRSLDTTPMSIYGYTEEFPTYSTYANIDCTFLAPLIGPPGRAKNDVLHLLHAWQELIQPRMQQTQYGTLQDGNMMLQFPDSYRLREGMELELLNVHNAKRNETGLDVNLDLELPIIGEIGGKISFRKRGEADEAQYASQPTIRYKFFNVYPLNINTTEVGWGLVSEFQQISVTFAYSYWSIINPAPSTQ
jgi:hypothetical protein